MVVGRSAARFWYDGPDEGAMLTRVQKGKGDGEAPLSTAMTLLRYVFKVMKI
jgi:hypothetical protein